MRASHLLNPALKVIGSCVHMPENFHIPGASVHEKTSVDQCNNFVRVTATDVRRPIFLDSYISFVL